MAGEDVKDLDLDSVARNYNRRAKETEERSNVAEFGLDVVSALLEKGFRVIVSAGETIKYCDGEGRLLSEGGVNAFVHPPRLGEIPKISKGGMGHVLKEMGWYPRDFGEEYRDPASVERLNYLTAFALYACTPLEAVLVHEIIPPVKKEHLDKGGLF